MTIADAVREIEAELDRAQQGYGAFHSSHEGFAVIMEGFDELKKAVFLTHDTPGRSAAIRREAIHLGAMSLRLLVDQPTERSW